MAESINDEEIDRLEDIRRFGYPEKRTGDEECEYYTLPPKHDYLMKDWTSWRMKVNETLVQNTCKKNGHKHKPERTLTAPLEKKTPIFFKGNMSIHGQRIKDEYGGSVITEADDIETRIDKKIIDENFYMFGIPRISRRRSFNGINDISNMTRRLKLNSSGSDSKESSENPNLSSTRSIRLLSKTRNCTQMLIKTAKPDSQSLRSKVNFGTVSSFYDDPIYEDRQLIEPLPDNGRGHSDPRLQLPSTKYIMSNDYAGVLFEEGMEDVSNPNTLYPSANHKIRQLPSHNRCIRRHASVGQFDLSRGKTQQREKHNNV